MADGHPDVYKRMEDELQTFFESVIRENLDLGRPERVQLLFDRKIIPNLSHELGQHLLATKAAHEVIFQRQEKA